MESPGILKRLETLLHISLAYLIQFVFRKYDWEYFWNYVADLWMYLNAYNRAIVASRKAKKISNSPHSTAAIGWCYLQLNQPAVALPYLEKAWEKMKEPGLALSLASCHWRLTNDDKVKFFIDYIETFPPTNVERINPDWTDEFNRLKQYLKEKSESSNRQKGNPRAKS